MTAEEERDLLARQVNSVIRFLGRLERDPLSGQGVPWMIQQIYGLLITDPLDEEQG